MSTVLERLEMCMQALSAGDTSLKTSPRTSPSCFSSSNESLIAAEVGAQCSTKEGGIAKGVGLTYPLSIAEQSHFSSKLGSISLDFEPWEALANGSASP